MHIPSEVSYIMDSGARTASLINVDHIVALGHNPTQLSSSKVMAMLCLGKGSSFKKASVIEGGSTRSIGIAMSVQKR